MKIQYDFLIDNILDFSTKKYIQRVCIYERHIKCISSYLCSHWSSFIENEDRNKLLKVSGNIKEENVKSVGDDGVSQSAAIKVGVASVAEVVIPNPVILAPFRTFPEVIQPESKFIFRMQTGPQCALYEADGGAWRNVAMEKRNI